MSASDNMKGAALMTVSTAAYTLNDASMKALAGHMPLPQVVFLRGVLTCLLLCALGMALRSLTFRLERREWKLMLSRSLAEAGATYCLLNALFNMPIANVTAVLQALPLTVALAAWAFVGEPLGRQRLAAILVGFIGVILIVKPGGDGFNAWSIYALIAVGFVTARDILVRKMSSRTPSMTVAFVTAVAVTFAFGVASLGVEWAPVDSRSGLFLSLAAVFIIVGYLFGIMVMRVGDIGFVAPFRYTGLIWALLLGLVFFGEWPDTMTFAGACIVVAMGLFTLLRERHLVRQLKSQA
ncbi:DMT family transporter [Aliiroseovarius sediminis]|uniref:DMT family transporter n=1 Tax=Aliiroseovarius sediminis TaxID=2925839 RepID=UPI001F595D6B|nr:DMT family transporter [Aliiroseovarius sediminis]MCI2394904.1 DMT family transporter [Aliiroseovarius sediminis]